MTNTLLTVGAAVLTSLFAVLGVVVAQLYQRVAALEGYSRRLWAYTRYVLDLYYRHRAPGSPDPDPLPDDD